MRVPETGRPKTVSLFSSTTKRPPRATEIFEVPLEAFASAFGCPTNFIVRVYSPARLARNSCSGPGIELSSILYLLDETSGFLGDESWAKTAVGARSSSAANKAIRPHDCARFIDIPFAISYWIPKTALPNRRQDISIGWQPQLGSEAGSALNGCVRLFQLCHRADELRDVRGRRCPVRVLRG